MGKMAIQLPTLTINKLIFITALYFTLVFNYPFLHGFMSAIIELPNFNTAFLACIPLVILCLLIILLSAVSLPYVVKPALIVLILISSLVFYGTVTYGVVFDYGMVENSMETNNAEALSYLNLEFVGFFIVFGLVPSWLIYLSKLDTYTAVTELFERVMLVGCSILVLTAIGYFFYQDIASVGRNNSHLRKYLVPSQYISSTINYIKRHHFDAAPRFLTLDSKPVDMSPQHKEVVVLVVGETARAKNFSLNGYAKPTNGHTKKFDLVSFKQMYSCGTATAVSVPCMFSSLDREQFDRRTADQTQNVLDILNLAGVDVLWVDNNGCKDVCNRVPTVSIDVNQASDLCDGKYCQDEALLVPLQKKLANLSDNKTVVVLHMMGSHGPTYFQRYPDHHRVFTPDCNRSDIQNCTQQQLENTYDNTIHYSDYVLSQVIEQLTQLPDDIQKSMVYVSDHGESLGEAGVYLHGFPYAFSPEEQRHIPMLVWMEKKDKTKACLNKIADDTRFSHDNVFHSLLGLLNVKSATYQPSLDIFSQCPTMPKDNAATLAKHDHNP